MGRVHVMFFTLPKAVLLLPTICLMVATAQAVQTGFISIDCGSVNSSYEDPIGLIWKNDDDFIQTGSNGVVLNQIDSSLENVVALKSFRYFPKQRNKHCFVLNMSSNSVSVLIRAMFLHGRASELVQPVEFNVSVNANIWFPVRYISKSDDELVKPIIQEGIFPSPGLGENIYVCLLPTQGVPFISSLELRPLDPMMYNFTDRDHRYLTNLRRLNFGASPTASTVRYPQDQFDRLWLNPNKLNMKNETEVKQSLSPLGRTNANDNSVPSEVMSDGLNAAGSSLTVKLPQMGSKLAYMVFYLATLQEVWPETSAYSIYLNYDLLITHESLDSPDNTISEAIGIGLPTNEAILQFEWPRSSILSAAEFYEENVINPTATSYSDERSANQLKKVFKMTDWQGDPCVPVPYEWLGCDLKIPGDSYDLYISHVALSDLNDKGSLLDLQGNRFFSSVVNLSLTNCSINDHIAEFLISNKTYSNLGALNFNHNNITNLHWLFQSKLDNLEYLDLSYNHLAGTVPSFVNVPTAKTIETLNLSYNALSNLPPGWGNGLTDNTTLDKLVVLDVSHNKITSDIQLFDELVLRNEHSLQELHISDNNITGDFPSEIYFDTLKQIKLVDLDRNNIDGVLNLTIWHRNLQQTNSSFVPVNQIFSFLNNSITGIIPEELHSTINFLLQQDNSSILNSSDSGVLLGGNPYCENAKSLSQRYLCRFSLLDKIRDDPKNTNNNILIIVIITGGASLLICSAIFIGIIWRLWTKVRVLQSIQQALADQKVQPPYYSYHDLKMATNDYHKDNILGVGGFGVVYKGVLSDGSVIAVKKLKKLLHSDQQKELNDFLNEVVLITGIKHRNLTQLRGCCIKERGRILVYEFVEQGNLAEALWGALRSKMILNWTQRFDICVNVARGLAYLHEELQPRIIHRDIKAANILLDRNFNPKIADFGLAKSILEEGTQADFTRCAGTRGYIAPEYVTEGQLTAKADVYSFGILVLEIVSGRTCIDPILPSDQISLKSWNSSYSEAEVLKVICIALICVQFNPKCRPTMSQVVTMFLGNVDIAHFLETSQRHQPDFDAMFAIKDDPTNSDVNIELGETSLLYTSIIRSDRP